MRIHTGTTRVLTAVGCALGIAALGSTAALSAGAASSAATDGVTVPALIKAGHASAPPTTASCQQSIQLNCYSPAQIQQAYSLNGIYGQGINGKGVTISSKTSRPINSRPVRFSTITAWEPSNR